MRKAQVKGHGGRLNFVKNHILTAHARFAGSISGQTCCCGKAITPEGEYTSFTATPIAGGEDVPIIAGNTCAPKLVAISNSFGRSLRLPELFNPHVVFQDEPPVAEARGGGSRLNNAIVYVHPLNVEVQNAIQLLLFLNNMQPDPGRASGKILNQINAGPGRPVRDSDCKSVNSLIRKIGKGDTLSKMIGDYRWKHTSRPLRAFAFPLIEAALVRINEKSML